MRAKPLSGEMRGRHLSHHGMAKTQPHIQMGPCRVRPVRALRTVGEIEISAQRLDLEGKHSALLCPSGKSRTLVSYKWLTYLQNKRWPLSVPTVCVIYEEHAMVKYPHKAYSDFGQVCVIIISLSPRDSQVLSRHERPNTHCMLGTNEQLGKWLFVFFHLTFAQLKAICTLPQNTHPRGEACCGEKREKQEEKLYWKARGG